MKIFLSGQRSFGKAVLLELLNCGHTITGVAVSPQAKQKDKMVGVALMNKIPIVADGESLKASDIPDGTDLIVSAHSHWIISDKCVEKCKYGGIGFHPSLLPLHRGQDAVRWAIHMGDKVTGATVYSLSPVCDGGDIVLQRAVFIKPGWDYHKLWEAIFPIGVEMLSEAVRQIESGEAHYIPQDEDCATFEPSWDRPRLKRNDLIMLGGFAPQAVNEKCDGCVLDCNFCTYNIADPDTYYRR